MSWTDIKSVEQIKKLRDRFGIRVFVETGTFRGQNAEVHSLNFNTVITIEIIEEYYLNAMKRLRYYPNVIPILKDSAEFLKEYTTANIGKIRPTMFFLDAHFYDPLLSPEDRWVILKELRALEGFKQCVIVIHDFNCNGLGGLVYDEQPLNFEFVHDALSKVNPNFHYYFNTFEGCEILTKDKLREGKMPPLVLDEQTSDTLDFVWSKPETIHRAYRGLLYATPEPLDLKQFELVDFYELTT